MLKGLRATVAATGFVLIGGALISGAAWSMDELSDSQLSTTTGQDGITASITLPTLTAANKATVAGGAFGIAQTSGLMVGAAILYDKDGFAGYTSGGALIFGDASQANSGNIAGVQAGVYASSPISLVVDATGNGATGTHGIVSGAAPVLSIAVNLPSDLLIRTGDVSLDVSKRTVSVGITGQVAIAVGASNAAVGGTLGTAYQIMKSMDIAFGGATSLNLQLGRTPQGGLLTFSDFNIPSMSFGLGLVSPNGGAVASSSLTASAVVKNLKLTGAQVDAVNDLSGYLTGGTENSQGGMVLQDTSMTVDSLQLNDVTAGSVSSIPNGNFGGTNNASMGSFGITNLTVSNLKIGVSGM